MDGITLLIYFCVTSQAFISSGVRVQSKAVRAAPASPPPDCSTSLRRICVDPQPHNQISSVMLRKLHVLLFATLCASALWGQSNQQPQRTLRVDYDFSGTKSEQHISVAELSSFEGWAGRTTHTDSVPLRGNGDITLRDSQTGRILYRQSFSTLFQEWLATEEATHTARSFENTYLLPMPEAPADITIRLFGITQPDTLKFTHHVTPSDILIRRLDKSPIPPHRYLWTGQAKGNKIDVAIVAEGYTEGQAEAFYKDADTAVKAILSHEPFKEYADRFNFVAVAAASRDSDVSIPHEGLWRNTALSSNFSTFYSERYLTTLRQRDLHNLLARIPYEHIIILANTYTYGGGGIYNAYTLTTTHHAAFRPVVVHEFGHSFGGLADEYYYDDQYENYYRPNEEPWEQNITTLADLASKWQDMLPRKTRIPTPPDAKHPDRIGVYEGGGYMSKGVYRAFQDCRMKTNECRAFCPVCQRALKRLIEFYTEQ